MSDISTLETVTSRTLLVLGSVTGALKLRKVCGTYLYFYVIHEEHRSLYLVFTSNIIQDEQN